MTDIIKIIETEKPKKWLKDFFIEIFDLVSFLVFVWWIVLFVRFFIFNPYTVVWQSMEPTFDEKDFIIVDKITPKVWSLKRWDVVVFVPPGKEVPYIKRIVWLPWDTVKLLDGWVYVCNNQNNSWENCIQLQEDYLTENQTTKAACWVTEFSVTTWAYFVLWDNRDHSTDSRCCFGLGCYSWANYLVPDNYIIWKVYVRVLPHFQKF